VRGYLSVTPLVLGEFFARGTYRFESAFATTRLFFQENPEVDEEEREFELSWLASQDSRKQQGSGERLGFVLAVDLSGAQTGNEIGAQIELLSEILWLQVESLLVAESAEPELTWYASQEIAEHLQLWMV
jgi:hypothetical protein